MEWFLKNPRRSQPEESRVALGVDQRLGFGVSDKISLGIAAR
jgi:hypothetical protein